MVHEPQLARDVADELRRIPPRRPLVLLMGHTHVASFHMSTNFTEINGATIGGGGTGNFEKNQPFGLRAPVLHARGRLPAGGGRSRSDRRARGLRARAERFRIAP